MKSKILGILPLACLMLVIGAVAPTIALAAEDTLLMVEQPLTNSTYSGVANLRGWAVSTRGIDRIELLIDGVLNTAIPSGASRPDVAATFSSYPNADKSGFSMAFNYANLTPGQHTFLIRAIDNQGNAKAQTITFFTVRFDVPGNFLSDPTQLTLVGSELKIGPNGRSVQIKNMKVNNKPYTILLDWDTASQDFAITQLSKVDQ
jgi:hypothetical protein